MTQPQEQQQSKFTPEIPPAELQLPSEKVTTIVVDDIKNNSILIITVDVNSPAQKMAVAPVFSKLLAPYTETLRNKRVTVMLMSTKENINLIPEDEMNKAGWYKKEESRLILPFSK